MAKDCGWGHTTPVGDCDACDSWTSDPDTGWMGFTDHYLGKHFNSDKEKEDYIKKNGYNPVEDDTMDGWAIDG